MSDHIAHLGICDDSFRLASALPGLEPVFKEVMQSHRDAAHTGSITRYADKWTVPIIRFAGDQMQKPEADRDPRVREKLAFTLGSLTHRAADRLTKPITKCWPGKDQTGHTEGQPNANESKIMQDLLVFREVYDRGRSGDGASLFSPTIFQLPDSADAQEKVFQLLLRRSLIAMHTFNPDAANIHDWLDAVLKGVQQFPKSLKQYAELDRDWDPAKVKLYLTDKHFYDADEPLTQMARQLQQGRGSVTPEQVDEAHRASDANGDTHRSRYERTLAKALDYLRAADDWYHQRIDEAEATRRFDIGVPELSLHQ